MGRAVVDLGVFYTRRPRLRLKYLEESGLITQSATTYEEGKPTELVVFTRLADESGESNNDVVIGVCYGPPAADRSRRGPSVGGRPCRPQSPACRPAHQEGHQLSGTTSQKVAGLLTAGTHHHP